MGQHQQLRVGTHAEYQFQSVISRYCQVVPVPRQEDFGEDFVCATLMSTDEMVLQGIRFRVQVKSSLAALTRPIGGWRGGRCDVDRVRWLLGRDQFSVAPDPLLLAVSDPKAGTVDLYLPQHIWEARADAGTPTELVYSSASPPALGRGRRGPYRNFTTKKKIPVATMRRLPPDSGDGRKWTIPLGPPIISLPQGETALTSEVPSWFHRVMREWAKVEQLNRAMANLNIPLAWHYDAWNTNEAPSEDDLLIRAFWSTAPDQNLQQTEDLAHSLLACLVGNYEAQDLRGLARRVRGARDLLHDRVMAAHPARVRG
ncbi:MAG: hypothetical protein Q8P41_15705 [Pseudomonadota bacterium]|nr:hypothetical protein [Pseudomonadota bacterium]